VASVVWLTASINQKTSNCEWINKRCELKKKKSNAMTFSPETAESLRLYLSDYRR
jgi:hypothetical protein